AMRGGGGAATGRGGGGEPPVFPPASERRNPVAFSVSHFDAGACVHDGDPHGSAPFASSHSDTRRDRTESHPAAKNTADAAAVVQRAINAPSGMRGPTGMYSWSIRFSFDNGSASITAWASSTVFASINKTTPLPSPREYHWRILPSR